jgi:mRNA interferase MazF/mRNA interferase ChpB
LAFVAPITSTIRGIKLEVVLDETLKTHGAILVHQIKSFDFAEREAVFIEPVSGQIIEQVKTVLKAIID